MFPKEIRGSNFTNIEVQCLLQNQESQIKKTKKFNFLMIKGLHKKPRGLNLNNEEVQFLVQNQDAR